MKDLIKRIVSASAVLFVSAAVLSGFPEGTLKASAGEVYDIYVGKERVETSNCKDILGNGVFSYEPETSTLTIDGNYGYESAELISSNIEDLTVNVIGDSELKGYFYFYKDTTITGTGKLSLSTSDSLNAITLYGGTLLTIMDADLDISGCNAISGSIRGTQDIYISGSYINAHGKEAAICDLNTVSIFRCDITKPAYCFWGEGGIYEADMTTYAKDVRMIPSYDLWIDENKVNADNCHDILDNGIFSYDPVQKMLTISGSFDHPMDQELIYSSEKGLIINVTEDSEIPGYTVLHEDTVITGKGVFITGTGTSSGNSITAIANHNCKLTIDNTRLMALGHVGIGTTTGSIDIYNSDVLAAGSEQAFAFAPDSFNIYDGNLSFPSPYTVGNNTIYDGGSKAAKMVAIERLRVKGDINGDGIINVTDLSLAAAYVKGKRSLNEDQESRADISGDGKITITDISIIAAHIKGKKAIV